MTTLPPAQPLPSQPSTWVPCPSCGLTHDPRAVHDPVLAPDGAPPAPMVEPAPLTVTAQPDSELAQLQALYASTKADAEEAVRRHKAITDSIKLRLTELDPNQRRFELTAAGDAPTLRVTYTVSNRFDSKRFGAEHPEVYKAYLKESGSWTLKAGA